MVNDGYPVLPDSAGKTFRTTLREALNSKAEIVQIATWNDWGEGTQIEPDLQFQFRDLEHLQTVLISADEQITRQDLRTLPHQIFQLRKRGRAHRHNVDEAVKAICNGDLEAARRIIGKLQ